MIRNCETHSHKPICIEVLLAIIADVSKISWVIRADELFNIAEDIRDGLQRVVNWLDEQANISNHMLTKESEAVLAQNNDGFIENSTQFPNQEAGASTIQYRFDHDEESEYNEVEVHYDDGELEREDESGDFDAGFDRI